MEQYRVVNTPQGPQTYLLVKKRVKNLNLRLDRRCLLYTSDAADD